MAYLKLISLYNLRGSKNINLRFPSRLRFFHRLDPFFPDIFYLLIQNAFILDHLNDKVYFTFS